MKRPHQRHIHRRYQELSDSIREHLDEKVADLMDRGMTREQAERAARREFGNVTRIEERSREVWQWPRLESIWADIRFASRQLRKTPGFAATAILTLSLGIAATVAIFAVVNSALIEPLPYPAPSRLVRVFESIRQAHRMTFSHDNYLDVRRNNRVFASIAAYDVRRNFILQNTSGAEQVDGASVTGDFFRTLGVQPMLGRDFSATLANESLTAASSNVILSYAAWQTYFAGSDHALGKVVVLNGEPYTVIGVMPRTFQFAPMGAVQFWMTLHPFAKDSCESQRGCHVMGVIARLKPGVTLTQALENVRSIAMRLKQEYPGADRDENANIAPLDEVILGNMRPILWTLLGGAGLLLLIAYINLAGLLLVRSENRRHEFAIRGALGAGRSRLIRQFITEGLMIVVGSGAIGFSAALLAHHFLLKLIPADMLSSMPYLKGSIWNGHVAVFFGALILIACAIFCLTPTLRLPLAGLRSALSEGDRGSAGTAWRRLGSRLIVLELATTVVLLMAAGLLGKSFYKLLHVNMGFNPEHLATLQIVAPEAQYSKPDQQVTLQREIIERLSHLPGVTGAGTANGLPVGWIGTTSINFAGETNLTVGHEVGERQVSTGYFSTLGAQLVRGRCFTKTDNSTAPQVVIINQSLAHEYFPDKNPIGKLIFPGGQLQHPMQIVGVIADVKEGALGSDNIPFIYRPFLQSPNNGFGIVVRTSQEPVSLLPTVVGTVHSIDPGIAISDPSTMIRTIGDSPAAYLHRVSAWLVGGFAVLAFVLSIVGLYGVIAYSVSRRTREIGVRMALGAQRATVSQLILKEAGWMAFLGIGIGLMASIAANILLMRALLFDVRPWDVSVASGVVIVLMLSAMLASYIPARRAAAVDPTQALRSE